MKMSEAKTDQTLAGLNIDRIVQLSLQQAGVAPRAQGLDESYVAQAKTFPQVSERVSDKTKAAHKALYEGYVQALNKASAELDTADRGGSGPDKSPFRDLKVTEARSANAVWLHDLYFANCFDPHSQIYSDTKSYMRLERDWGTFDDWQQDFIACAMAAQEGWVAMGYSTFLRRYVNTVIDGHDGHVMLGLYPVLVIDVWSHAYFRDYMTDRQSYVVAQMREINWQVVEERMAKAEKIAEALK